MTSAVGRKVCVYSFFVSLSLMGSGLVLAQVDPLDFVEIVPITDNNPVTNELGRDRAPINSTPFKIESLITVGDEQFTTYFRDDGKLIFARRDLTNPVNDWDIHVTEFTSYKIDDSHNVSSIGIDGDGYLHTSWGLHAHPLTYSKSLAPVTGGGALNLVGDAVGNAAAINTMAGSFESRATYTNFYRIPNSDDLLFKYRNGYSGNGTWLISRYDATTGGWSWVNQDWLRSTDPSGLTYNAYPHNLTYDPNGGLHATWTLRYNNNSPTGNITYQTNHNIYYGFSPDHGATWYRDIDGTIPYTGNLIDDQTSEIIVPLPEGSSLINTGTQAIDAYGRPAIATWWAPYAHDTPPDHRRQYQYVGHNGDNWFTSQLDHRRSDSPGFKVMATDLGLNHMGRPQIAFDDYNRCLFQFKDNDRGGVVTVAISQADARDDWDFLDLTTTDLGRYEPTFDRALWDSERKLHTLVQTIDGNSNNGGSQMYVVEWDAQPALGPMLCWTGAASANWDTTAINFTDLGLPVSFHLFDNVLIDDTAANTSINFPGPVQAGMVSVDSVRLNTFSGPGSLIAGSLAVVGGGVLDLATSGNSYTGRTRVANAILMITGDANAMVSPMVVADNGTLIMDAIDASDMTSSFEIWPTGVLRIGTVTSEGDVFPDNPGPIINDGLIVVNDDEVLSNIEGFGTIEVAHETTTLTNNPNHQGDVIIKAGAVAVVNTVDGLGLGSGEVRVEDGGRLELATSGTFQKVVEVSGSGGGLGALTVDGASDVVLDGELVLLDETLVSVAAGSQAIIATNLNDPNAALTKSGAGQLVLSGANSYDGPTRVQAGTLTISGTTGTGDTIVENGGILEFGQVLGNLIVEAAGTVRAVSPSLQAGATSVILEEQFSGSSVSLNGRFPDTVSDGKTWSAHSGIDADGQGISISGGGSATLPFTPEAGYIYTLDVSFRNLSGDADWFAAGFVEGVTSGGTGNEHRFIFDPTTGKAWLMARGNSEANNTFLGSTSDGTSSGAAWPTLNSSSDYDVRVVLDTTGGVGNYEAEFFAKLPADASYTSLRGPVTLLAEDIGAVGFAASHSDTTGDVSFFRLQQAVVSAPEVILEEQFTGLGMPLNGRFPDTVNDGSAWAAHPSIDASGVGVAIPVGGSATLPFTPADGHVYTLDVSLRNLSGDNDWFGVGFVESTTSGGTGNTQRFISDPTTGKAWMIIRGDAAGNNSFLGSASSGTTSAAGWPSLNNNGGDYDVRVVLNTGGGAGNYQAEFYAKLPAQTTYTLMRGPETLLAEDIGAVGFANSNSDTTGDVTLFRLTRAAIGGGGASNGPSRIGGDALLADGTVFELTSFSSSSLTVPVIDGTLTADGTLRIVFDPNATAPSVGTWMTVIEAGSVSGEFDDVEVVGLPWGRIACPFYTGKSVEIEIAAGVIPVGNADDSYLQSFQADYTAGSPLADVNGDTLLTSDDVSEFVNRMPLGCATSSSSGIYAQLTSESWTDVFDDSGTGNWTDQWMLDGLQATITNSPNGMNFSAGPNFGQDAHHAVLWTQPSFTGSDIRIDYEYTRLDNQIQAVTILYILATGKDISPYEVDISLWNNLRTTPSMSKYFNNMNLYHISYAAFDIGNSDPKNDYVRARRYMPLAGQGLNGTGLAGDYTRTGLFATGVPHQISVIKKGDDLFMNIVADNGCRLLCHWKTDSHPQVTDGRVGLRHMYTRSARYQNFRISIPSVTGDINGDRSVDGQDLPYFEACMGGPSNPNPGCPADDFAVSDIDNDGDVDAVDADALLQAVGN